MSTSSASISGIVTATVRCARTGRVLSVSRGKNKLVDEGRRVLRDHLGGVGFRPSHIGAGQGQTATTGGMTALESEAIRKTIDRRDQLAFGVDLQVIIDAAEANGTTFREIATFEDNRMLARALIIPPIEKNESVEVTLSHVLTVNAG